MRPVVLRDRIAPVWEIGDFNRADIGFALTFIRDPASAPCPHTISVYNAIVTASGAPASRVPSLPIVDSVTVGQI